MATENLDGIYSLPAGADLSSSQYQAVKVNTSGQVVLCGANAADADGILHNAPASGALARFITLRGVVVKARLGTGGATIGALLATDASGKLVIATSGQNVVAKAHRFAGAANEIIEVLWWGNRGAVAP